MDTNVIYRGRRQGIFFYLILAGLVVLMGAGLVMISVDQSRLVQISVDQKFRNWYPGPCGMPNASKGHVF